ncbi:MAG: DUF3343 domain-containing protein [Spirochaetales bacterium]|nr:DUF3343 domain-containing protein [Spirochaetales bacterium]
MKVVIFRSTRDVIQCEKECRKVQIGCRVIPVPRSISPLCGMALEIKDEAGDAVLKVTEGLSIKVEIFDRDKVKL